MGLFHHCRPRAAENSSCWTHYEEMTCARATLSRQQSVKPEPLPQRLPQWLGHKARARGALMAVSGLDDLASSEDERLSEGPSREATK